MQEATFGVRADMGDFAIINEHDRRSFILGTSIGNVRTGESNGCACSRELESASTVALC